MSTNNGLMADGAPAESQESDVGAEAAKHAPQSAIWWAPWESNPAPTDHGTKPDRQWGRESGRSVTSFPLRIAPRRKPNRFRTYRGSAAFRNGKSRRINEVGGGGPNRFRTEGARFAAATRGLSALDCSDRPTCWTRTAHTQSVQRRRSVDRTPGLGNGSFNRASTPGGRQRTRLTRHRSPPASS